MNIIMPKDLSAENGAKALLLGEFKEVITFQCPECDPDEPSDACDICDGEGLYKQPVTIAWHTIKKIYKKAVDGLGKDIAVHCPMSIHPGSNQYDRTLISMFITFMQVNFIWPCHDQIGTPGKRLTPDEIFNLKDMFCNQTKHAGVAETLYAVETERPSLHDSEQRPTDGSRLVNRDAGSNPATSI